MANNENYEKDSRQKLIDLLNKFGWQGRGRGIWEKVDVRLLVDDVGVFLYRWLGHRWVRTHGRAHASKWRVISHRAIVFSDFAKLDLEDGVFFPPGGY